MHTSMYTGGGGKKKISQKRACMFACAHKFVVVSSSMQYVCTHVLAIT